jgi:hypothetical protein
MWRWLWQTLNDTVSTDSDFLKILHYCVGGPINLKEKSCGHYSPTGRRNHGRPLKRLLDTWDRNGSTSGPTPWKIDEDDEKLWSVSKSYSRIRLEGVWDVIEVLSGVIRYISVIRIGTPQCKSQKRYSWRKLSVPVDLDRIDTRGGSCKHSLSPMERHSPLICMKVWGHTLLY